MAERNDPELNIRVTLLLSQIESRIPERLRSRAFSGKKVAVPVSCDPFLISSMQILLAEKLLRQLPEKTAIDAGAGSYAEWRQKPVVEMLQAWGWAASINDNGSLRIHGIYGDVVFSAGFAAIAALAPLCGNGQMVFTADRHGDDELFAVQVRNGKLQVHGAQKRVTYVID